MQSTTPRPRASDSLALLIPRDKRQTRRGCVPIAPPEHRPYAPLVVWLVRSALAILYPRSDALPGVEDCDFEAFLRRFRAEAPPLMWLGIVAGALLFHLSPIATVHVPLPAFMLPEALADTHANRISTTQLYLVRQAIFLLKIPAGLAWGANPRVREKLALPALAEDPGTWRTS